MTTVNDNLKKINPCDPEQTMIHRINMAVNSLCHRFRSDCVQIIKDSWLDKEDKSNRLQNLTHQFEQTLNELNAEYKQHVLKVDVNSKKYSIYVMSHRNVKLYKIAEQLFSFNYAWSDKSVNYDKVKKPAYTPDKLHRLMISELAMLFSKYGDNLYAMNITAGFYKCISRFFDITSVNWNTVDDVLRDVMNTDINNVYVNIEKLGFNAPKMPNQIRSFTPAQKKRLMFPEKEDLKLMIAGNPDMSRSELEKKLAKVYDVSQRTIHRLFKKYDLTRDYKN